MTLIVNQLESFDKSNLEVIRIEFAKLQRKLEECQTEQELIKPDIGKKACRKFLDNGLKIRYRQPLSSFFLFLSRQLQSHRNHEHQQTNGDPNEC